MTLAPIFTIPPKSDRLTLAFEGSILVFPEVNFQSWTAQQGLVHSAIFHHPLQRLKYCVYDPVSGMHILLWLTWIGVKALYATFKPLLSFPTSAISVKTGAALDGRLP